MLLRTLDYEEQFHCLAGRCPHSCCIGWEVVLDEDHARRYLAGDDPLSRRAAEAMVYDEEEDAFAFPLSGGRCPFLDGENLCALHRAWGAEATPLTCQTHPRFTEDYGPFAERALSAACPAANALLLGSREPLGFRESETGEPGEEGDEWLPYLVPFRQRLFTVLQDRSRPLRARLAEFLTLCLLGDAVLADAEQEGTAPEGLLTLEGGTLSGMLPEEGIFPAGFRLLASLEVLEPDWRDVLARAGTAAPVPQDEALLERIGGILAAPEYANRYDDDLTLVLAANTDALKTAVLPAFDREAWDRETMNFKEQLEKALYSQPSAPVGPVVSHPARPAAVRTRPAPKAVPQYRCTAAQAGAARGQRMQDDRTWQVVQAAGLRVRGALRDLSALMVDLMEDSLYSVEMEYEQVCPYCGARTRVSVERVPCYCAYCAHRLR